MAAKSKTEWLRAGEFQKRLQITAPAFRKARAQKILTEKKIHGINLVEWFESRNKFIDQSQHPTRYTKEAIAKRRKANGKKPPEDPKPDDKNGKASPGKKPPKSDDEILTAGNSKLEAEAIKQKYLAKAAKLKFLKDSGLLIEVAVVEKSFQDIAGHLKKLILGVPNRVAGIYATMKDPRKIKIHLEKELKAGLTVAKYKGKKIN